MRTKNKWKDINSLPSWAEKVFYKKLSRIKNRHNKNIGMILNGKTFRYKAEFIADDKSGWFRYCKKKQLKLKTEKGGKE